MHGTYILYDPYYIDLVRETIPVFYENLDMPGTLIEMEIDVLVDISVGRTIANVTEGVSHPDVYNGIETHNIDHLASVIQNDTVDLLHRHGIDPTLLYGKYIRAMLTDKDIVIHIQPI